MLFAIVFGHSLEHLRFSYFFNYQPLKLCPFNKKNCYQILGILRFVYIHDINRFHGKHKMLKYTKIILNKS